MAFNGVISITAPALLCPIVSARGQNMECYYATGAMAIWDKSRVDEVIPAALQPSAGSYSLRVLVHVPKPGAYTLTGELGGKAITPPTIVAIDPTTLTGTSEMVLQSTKLPWGFRGAVTWNLKEASGDLIQTQTKIEVYALASPLPRFFHERGIPLDLLRTEWYMTDWTTSNKTDWAEYVVQRIFDDSRMQYEVFSGASRYTNFRPPGVSSALDAEIICWIELWLSDMEGLVARKDTTTRYSVNCYDVAVLAWVLISLGRSHTKLNLAYLEPFGFLRGTHLIGRQETDPNELKTNPTSLCNNPFYGGIGYAKAMLCNDLDPTRSGFGNHMFVLLQKAPTPLEVETTYVLDACAGPQIGNLKVEDYVDACIDLNPKVYAKPPRSKRITPGTFGDIEPYQGVSDLAITSSFLRDPTNVPRLTLFNLFFTELKKKGTLQAPYVGTGSTPDSIVGTYTYTPSKVSPADLDETVTFNFYRFERDAYLMDAFEERKEQMGPNPTEYSANDVANPICNGGLRMFYNLKVRILVTIDTVVAGSLSNEMVGWAKSVQGVLDQLGKDEDFYRPKLDIVISPKTISVGSTLPVKLAITPVRQNWWRGFSAVVTNGSALLTKANISAQEEITFEFLARKVGLASIKIVLVGPNLDRSYVHGAVVIKER